MIPMNTMKINVTMNNFSLNPGITSYRMALKEFIKMPLRAFPKSKAFIYSAGNIFER